MVFELKARTRELTAEEFVARGEEKLRIERDAEVWRIGFAYQLLAALIMRAHNSELSHECKQSATAQRLNTLRRRLLEPTTN